MAGQTHAVAVRGQQELVHHDAVTAVGALDVDGHVSDGVALGAATAGGTHALLVLRPAADIHW